jgi:hypothetical protein
MKPMLQKRARYRLLTVIGVAVTAWTSIAEADTEVLWEGGGTVLTQAAFSGFFDWRLHTDSFENLEEFNDTRARMDFAGTNLVEAFRAMLTSTSSHYRTMILLIWYIGHSPADYSALIPDEKRVQRLPSRSSEVCNTRA